MLWMSKLTEKTKTPRKTQKDSNHLKNKRITNIEMSAKGGPIFTFSLPRGAYPLDPLQLRHCLHVPVTSSLGLLVWSKIVTNMGSSNVE